MKINAAHSAIPFRRNAAELPPEELLKAKIRFSKEAKNSLEGLDFFNSPYWSYKNSPDIAVFTVPKVKQVVKAETEYTLNDQGKIEKKTDQEDQVSIEIQDTNPEKTQVLTRDPLNFLDPLKPELFEVVEEKN